MYGLVQQRLLHHWRRGPARMLFLLRVRGNIRATLEEQLSVAMPADSRCEKNQDDGEGGLSLRGVAFMTVFSVLETQWRAFGRLRSSRGLRAIKSYYTPPPRRNHCILHRFDVMTPKMILPRILQCNGQPHKLHTNFGNSKCNFFTRNGLQDNYVMTRK